MTPTPVSQEAFERAVFAMFERRQKGPWTDEDLVNAVAPYLNPDLARFESTIRKQERDQCAKVAEASVARLLPHETCEENSRWLQAACKMARAEAEAIARAIRKGSEA